MTEKSDDPNVERHFDRVKSQYFNMIRTNVGELEGNKLVYLGYIRDCTGEKCPLSKECPYTPKGKCKFEQNFMNTMYTSWADPYVGIGDIMSQQQLHLLGSSLMPLYSQLIACEKVKMGIDNIHYEDPKGIKRMHPVLKEIRDINKMILVALKEAELLKTWEAKFGKNGKPPPKKITDASKGKRDRFKVYEDAMEKKDT